MPPKTVEGETSRSSILAMSFLPFSQPDEQLAITV